MDGNDRSSESSTTVESTGIERLQQEAIEEAYPRPRSARNLPEQTSRVDTTSVRAEELIRQRVPAENADVYLEAIRSGRLNERGLRRILSLSEDARAAIEPLLSTNNRMSRESLDVILSCEPPVIEGLMNNAADWRRVKDGLRDGHFDTATLTRWQLDAQARNHMRNLLQNGNIQPESFRQFSRLAVGDMATVLSHSHTPSNLAFLLNTFPDESISTWSRALKDNRADRQVLESISRSPARAELSALAASMPMDLPTLRQATSMAATGELTRDSIRLFQEASARRLWGSELSLKEVLDMPTAQRQAFESLVSAEIRSGGRTEAGTFRTRLDSFRPSVEMGLTNWNSISEVITTGGIRESILQRLQDDARRKPAQDRISATNFQRLTELSRGGEISAQSLDSYRRAIAAGALDNAALTNILSQSRENRQPYEALMMNVHTAQEMPNLRENLRLTPDQARIEASSHLRADQIEPGLFPPEGRFQLERARGTGEGAGIDRQAFADAMARRDFGRALSIVSAPSGAIEDSWRPVVVRYEELNSPDGMRRVIERMDSFGRADRGELTSSTRIASMPDVIVQLPDGRMLNLRQGSIGHSEGNSATGYSFRATGARPGDAAIIENIRQSRAGQVMLARMALIGYEEKLIHCYQANQGAIAPSMRDFQQSDSYRALVRHANGNTEQLNMAMREIEVAAALYDSGFSRADVQRLLGDRHLEGERSYYYDWLAQQPERQRISSPAEARPAPLNGRQSEKPAQKLQEKSSERDNGRPVDRQADRPADLPVERQPERPARRRFNAADFSRETGTSPVERSGVETTASGERALRFTAGQTELTNSQILELEVEATRLQQSSNQADRERARGIQESIRCLRGERGSTAREQAHREVLSRGRGGGGLGSTVGVGIIASFALGWYLSQQDHLRESPRRPTFR